MALYAEEEDIWKCALHPSRRRRTGICHVCLRERLASLCPDCASVRPCSCYGNSSSSSGSSSSSFSRFSIAAESAAAAGIGSVGRVSSLIESEPAFRRSRSVAVPFIRSKPAAESNCSIRKDSPKSASASAFWSLFRGGNGSRAKKTELGRNSAIFEKEDDFFKSMDEERRVGMMRKSRSVAVTSDSTGPGLRPSKGKGWHFPSPIKVFRQSISRGIGHERSPLYRG